MRTRYVLLIILFFLTFKGKSQNTITRPNYFTLGNYYPYTFLSNIEYDSVAFNGPNCVWDFSNAAFSGINDTLFAIDPSGTIFFNEPQVNYNLSNLCLYEPNGLNVQYDDSMYSYLIDNLDSIYFLGNWAYNGLWETWNYHLTDYELLFTFPFSYGNSFIDSTVGSANDLSGWGYCQVAGTKEVEALGMGILILPGATFNNVIKIKSHVSGLWSCGFGNYYDNTFHTFFDLDYNGPILEVSTNFLNLVGTTKYYFENPLISSLTEQPLQAGKVYPNPAFNQLIIESSNFSKNTDIEMFDIQGRKVVFESIKKTLPSKMEINVQNLKKGIYILQIQNQNNCIIKKIIKL